MNTAGGGKKGLKVEECQPQDLINFTGDLVYDMKPSMQVEEFHEFPPPLKKFKGQDNDSGSSSDDQPDFTPLNILDLPEDCLLIIFNYLPIEEQLQCARASKYFRDIFKTKFLFKNKFFYGVEFMHLPRQDIEDIFEFAGEGFLGVSLNIIERNAIRQIYVNLVTRYCSHLQKIHLSGDGIGREFIDKLHDAIFDITEACFIDIELDDGVVKELQRFKNLEVLSIQSSTEITGAYLSEFSKLQSLNLRNCHTIQARFFNQAIQNMKNLRLIDIAGCFYLGDALMQITQHNPELEILRMTSGNLSTKSPTALQALKELQICNFTKVRCQGMSKSSEFEYRFDFNRKRGIGFVTEFQNLKKLAIKEFHLDSGTIRKISELKNLEDLRLNTISILKCEGLLQVIECCNQLKVLMMPSTIFTEKDFNDIFGLLKSLTENAARTHKLTLGIGTLSTEFKDEANAFRILKKYQHPDILEITKIRLNLKWLDIILES